MLWGFIVNCADVPQLIPRIAHGNGGTRQNTRILCLPLSSLHKGVCRMNPETQQFESPYCVRIETETGQSATVPIAVLTPKQLEVFLQSEFKRLAKEAGVKGARIHVERAIAADYEQVLREVTACLSSAKARARSDEHTSELQSLRHLVCRLL